MSFKDFIKNDVIRYGWYDYNFEPKQDTWNIYRLYHMCKKHSKEKILGTLGLHWDLDKYIASVRRIRKEDNEKE